MAGSGRHLPVEVWLPVVDRAGTEVGLGVLDLQGMLGRPGPWLGVWVGQCLSTLASVPLVCLAKTATPLWGVTTPPLVPVEGGELMAPFRTPDPRPQPC